jgi:hypothetical protein
VLRLGALGLSRCTCGGSLAFLRSPVRTGGWRVPDRGEPVSSLNQTTKEKRADFIREAIEKELKRREAKPHK